MQNKISKDMLIESVSKVRQVYGLRKIKTGFRHCLKCDRRFWSLDLASIRMCCLCKDRKSEI